MNHYFIFIIGIRFDLVRIETNQKPTRTVWMEPKK